MKSIGCMTRSRPVKRGVRHAAFGHFPKWGVFHLEQAEVERQNLL
jgi:hypothetical protein